MFRKIIFAISVTTILLGFCISCDNVPKITARLGTAAHMELTKPSITKWAWQVQTPTYTYLTLYLTKNESGDYTLKTYYVYTASKGWEFNKDTITLPKNIYGEMIVTKAPDYEIR